MGVMGGTIRFLKAEACPGQVAKEALGKGCFQFSCISGWPELGCAPF